MRCGEHIDHDHAAAMVTARRGVPLTQVAVIDVDQT